jgi:hypothetical protein
VSEPPHLVTNYESLTTGRWALGPRSPPKEVFGGFQDNAGWGSVGLSVLVGQLAPIFSLLGADAVSPIFKRKKASTSDFGGYTHV